MVVHGRRGCVGPLGLFSNIVGVGLHAVGLLMVMATPPQVSLLSGWQNIAELLIANGADTAGVADIKASITCPDCKRVVAKYSL